MDKLNAITLFCRVIEAQSFTAAAQQEKISLAMASKLVAQLEEHLNVRLLQRTTRKITPTEAGLLFYQRCHPLLNELQEAENCVSDISAELQGKLSLSFPLDFGSRFIAPHLGKFAEQYPLLELDLDFSDRRVDVIAEGYDLVLRIGKLEDSSIVARRIGNISQHIVASPHYLAQHGTPKTLPDLEQHNCLCYANNPIWLLREEGQEVKFKPQGKLFSNNGYALVQMAKAGLGIINSPKFLIQEAIEKGELVPILTHLTHSPIDISLLYPHRRYLSPKVKVMIEFLAQLMVE
ncbi:LysR family transcriptional regulator [Pasteurellaceae bacterium Macca]|nr:LysR family transcriptional regulator [Pasteurellaceae bacterium Macca]